MFPDDKGLMDTGRPMASRWSAFVLAITRSALGSNTSVAGFG